MVGAVKVDTIILLSTVYCWVQRLLLSALGFRAGKYLRVVENMEVFSRVQGVNIAL